jgi:hypothetical protein
MSQIQKFSLLYDAAEDRLAWDTEDAEGGTTRLWLTQRLCRGLIGALLPMLKTAAPQVDAPLQQAAVQSWEQAAAMSSFGRVPGVQPKPQTLNGLVRAVHIRPKGEHLDLTFEFGTADTREVGLSQAALRQMLSVMHRLHVAAGWPLDLWPAWIAEPAPAGAAAALN